MKKTLAILANLLLLTPSTYGMTNQQRLNDELIQAIKDDDIELVKQTIEDGANRVLANDEGKTPLQDALTFGNREVIEILEPKPKKPGITSILTPKQIIKNNK